MKQVKEEDTSSWIDITIRFSLVALILYWSFLLLQPFIAILIWSIVLSIALMPIYVRLNLFIGNRPAIASLLLTILALVVLFGPVSTIGAALVKNLSVIASGISKGTILIPPPPEYINDLPLFGAVLSGFWQSASLELAATLKSIAPQLKLLAGNLLSLLGDIGIVLLQFGLATIITGFIFSRTKTFEKILVNIAVRAAPQMGEDLINLAEETVRSVTRGVVGISLIQSILFGVGAMIAGIPLVGLLTFFVLILSIIQIGPGIIIIPVIIFGWLSLDILGAVILTTYLIPVMLLDSVLKPILIGRGLKVPMLVIFIGVIGGIFVHGLIGLFIGPIVLAFCYELGKEWINNSPLSSKSDKS